MATIQEKLMELVFVVQELKKEAMDLAAAEMKSAIEKRIFEDGEDTKELPIGTSVGLTEYSKPYKKKRQKAGLETNKINYQFTGKLRSQLIVERTVSNSIRMRITGDRAEIAGYLEKKRGKVFFPTKLEIALGKRAILEVMKKYKNK